MQGLTIFLLLYGIFSYAHFSSGLSAGINRDARLPPTITDFNPPDYPWIFVGLTDPISFTCSASGLPKPSITWFLNGKELLPSSELFIFNEATDSQTVTSALLLRVQQEGRRRSYVSAQTGRYQCKAHNYVGTAVSPVATISEAAILGRPPPDIISKTFSTGSVVHFRCEAPAGFRPVDLFQWTRATGTGTEIIVDNDQFAVTEDGDLYISAVRPEDSGTYRCSPKQMPSSLALDAALYELRVTDELAESNEPRLIYKTPDQLVATSIHGNIHVVSGDRLKLQCVFSGYDDNGNPPHVNWNHRKKQYREGIQEGSTLLIEQTSKDTEGEYSCSAGEEMQLFHVVVLEKPAFTRGLIPVNVTRSHDHTFTCSARAYPPPKLSWFINAQPIAESPLSSRLRVSQLSSNETKLSIRDVTSEDVFNVQCNASNDVSWVLSSAYMNVVEPTRITGVFPEKSLLMLLPEVAADDQIWLSCNASADPLLRKELKLLWYLNDERLETDPAHILNLSSLFNETANIAPGNYSCVAVTSHDSDRREWAVIIALPEERSLTVAGLPWWLWIVLSIIIILVLLLICAILVMRQRRKRACRDPESERVQLADDGGSDGTLDKHALELPTGDGTFWRNLPGSSRGSNSDEAESLTQSADIDITRYEEDGSFIGQYGSENKYILPGIQTEV